MTSGLGLDKLDSSHVECVCVVVGTGNGKIGKWAYHVGGWVDVPFRGLITAIKT